MLEQKLIGYAAREMRSDYDQKWSTERKRNFLLKSDIIKPLSVDLTIWNSAFSPNIIRAIEQQERNFGWRQHTWSQLAKLERYLSEYNISNHWTIAITQFMDEAARNEVGVDYLSVEPDKIAPQWQFLGYDIAEMVLLSGLMNMGYSKHKTGDPQRYVSYLNEYHLFTDLDKAFSFAEWADKRDPGHGPFYVYGLYQTNPSGDTDQT